MQYSLQALADITNGTLVSDAPELTIQSVYYDTRLIKSGAGSLFAALKTASGDGHQYLDQARDKGVTAHLVSQTSAADIIAGQHYIIVPDTLQALQQIAAHHRAQYSIPVVGITGSNGKTIIKEWLSSMLAKQHAMVKTPRSYNSQLGVPISLLGMENNHEMGVFEAGISKSGEMDALAQMMRPTIGIFTNIGDAHGLGFDSEKDKVLEKLKLFSSCDAIIFCMDHVPISEAISEVYPKIDHHSWSLSANPNARYQCRQDGERLLIKQSLNKQETVYELPSSNISTHALENLCHCVITAQILRLPNPIIQDAILHLPSIDLRLELKQGAHGNLIIDDSYSLDLQSLEIALDFLMAHAQDRRKVLILTDFDDQKHDEALMAKIAGRINQFALDQILILGQYPELLKDQLIFGEILIFGRKAELMKYVEHAGWKDSAILVKGARRYQLEDISKMLVERLHETVMEINLSALDHNLSAFRNKISENCGIIAVIKADAYGSGSIAIAEHIKDRVDYFAVAYMDEGIALRQSGIQKPIIILNPERDHLDALWTYELEPQIYSSNMLDRIITIAERKNQPINGHIKVNTGMNRLGFSWREIPGNVTHDLLCIKTVFSHLAASEDPEQDDASRHQIERFEQFYTTLSNHIGYAPKRHILNSSGTLRYTDVAYELVRMGIGMYGVGMPVELIQQNDLQPVHTLKARISQIMDVPKGESVGYGHAQVMTRDSRIATINIGYADGILRHLGSGNAHFCIAGHPYPTVGHICMDSCMIDITDGQDLREGMSVEIFGSQNSVDELSCASGTISYELLSRISSRIRKVYVQE